MHRAVAAGISGVQLRPVTILLIVEPRHSSAFGFNALGYLNKEYHQGFMCLLLSSCTAAACLPIVACHLLACAWGGRPMEWLLHLRILA